MPGSPNGHINGALPFSNSGPDYGNLAGTMREIYLNDSEKQGVDMAAQIFPVELYRSPDSIATMQNFMQGIFSQLDLAMGKIRKDLLAFLEEPELELYV